MSNLGFSATEAKREPKTYGNPNAPSANNLSETWHRLDEILDLLEIQGRVDPMLGMRFNVDEGREVLCGGDGGRKRVLRGGMNHWQLAAYPTGASG